MPAIKKNKPGRLVKYRDRRWMVLPSGDDEITLLKPLGGTDEEITGVFDQLDMEEEKIEEDRFPLPSENDLGSFETAKMLFDASRLSFRNASGPFRSMGKLSFRPRAYQVVPLTLALKQDIVRLLIADDVGVGKTVEALIILRELLERGDVKRFAIITPSHLCDQWQQELKNKLDIDAEIIRTSTAGALERRLPDDRSVFHHFHYQVISIDYIKSEKRKDIFLNDCPEMVIVDEAHTCTKPEGAKSRSQQQRHSLIYHISLKPEKNLLLLTATPHSGKESEFKSLLGLLNKDFETFDLENISQSQRKKLARYFIQRKRENITRWMNEITPFPERESKEIAYSMDMEYQAFYQDVRNFAKAMGRTEEGGHKARVRYWAALALLRGVMSSPAAGASMLTNRQNKLEDSLLEGWENLENPLIDKISDSDDESPVSLLENSNLETDEQARIQELLEQINNLSGLKKDRKAAVALKNTKKLISEGFKPIIFCKYIETAKYLGAIFKDELPDKVDVRVVTSEMADEQRKAEIAEMGAFHKRLLIATDCLSEGINLQDHFSAVVHYDLPWNPNRIEQRDGRIDRFGQTAKQVKSFLLWGHDNPIDKIVLNILIRKVREIQKNIGVSIPLGDQESSIMDEVLESVLIEGEEKGQQLELFAEERISGELELAKEKAKNLRTIFAHEAIKPESIEEDLKEIDRAIGDMESVENFVIGSVQHLGASIISKNEDGYEVSLVNLPPHLKELFDKEKVKISFQSPTPEGYRYIGRNHRFTEQLCYFILSLAFDGHPEYRNVARVSEIQTGQVKRKTVLIMFRVRNVIKEKRSSKEIISEEMYLWGYSKDGSEHQSLSFDDTKKLLYTAKSTANISQERQAQDLKEELKTFHDLNEEFLDIATRRAEHLVESHGKFKQLVGGRQYEKATPVLPPDVMGLYIFIPKPSLNI